MKPVSTIISRIIVTLITMFMLAWASYTGYRLTAEPRRGNKSSTIPDSAVAAETQEGNHNS
ncbi:hypothetical protein TorRG33x02_253610 [Trema orientale]|uniref:Uncharacterized protein n=1 Tax=Trema orientale TaxID=63057 RepID=A0A2P5DEQ6_TREOI|nr:hypothetical protein TorRG33x02_253610 [Trema orientale]